MGKFLQSYCQKCGTEIMTYDSILFNGYCQNCFYKVNGIHVDAFKELKKRGAERLKKRDGEI